jgi:hypothetical protein
MGRFRVRKPIPVIPGILRMNVSASAGDGKKSGGISWTWHLGKRVSYNTKTGVTTVNTPGIGSWSSSTKAQRKARREEKSMWRFADAEWERQHFQDIQAGRTPDMNGPPSQRGLKTPPERYRKPRAGKAKPQPIAYCGRCGARLDGRVCPNGHGAARPSRAGQHRRERPADQPPQQQASGKSGSAFFDVSADDSGRFYIWGGSQPGSREVRIAGPFPKRDHADWWINEHYVDAVLTLREAQTDTLRPGDAATRACFQCGARLGIADRSCRVCGRPDQQGGESTPRTSGLCGARTKDGTKCLNSKNCPVPSHRSLL